MNEFKSINHNRLKVRFLEPEGKVSRRELLTLVLPHYEVIPFVEPALCRGHQECGLCLDACPLKAVKVEEDKAVVDTALCSGCGACVELCPHRAIVYPTFSLEALDKEMASFLMAGEEVREAGIIAAVCERCLPVSSQKWGSRFSHPESVHLLRVPCLVMASPWLMLRAFDLGAQGVVLISRGQCRCGFDSSRWQKNVRFVGELLDCWKIEAKRVGVLDVSGDGDGIEQELNSLVEDIARLSPTRLSRFEPTPVPDRGLRLPALLKGMLSKLGSPSRKAVSLEAVPFGKVELDGSRCTGCSLCALNCPTGALTVSAGLEPDTYRLFFKHELCVACRRCVNICPEKCLRLEAILELNRIDSAASLLFEDGFARCAECGSPIAPRVMIERLKARVRAAGQSCSQFDLCPECKIKVQFSRSSVRADKSLFG